MLRRFFHLVVAVSLSPGLWAQANPPPSGPKTPAIATVTFENVQALSSGEQSQITQSLQQKDRDWVLRQTPEALATWAEKTALAVYQDKGYWRAKVSAKVTWVLGGGSERRADLVITATNEGPQYWLKGITFTGGTAFPNNDLLQLMAMRPWEVVSRSKVAEGLEAIRRLYASRGYVAFSAVPQVEFDDSAHSVALLINVQEDSPFHFGSLSLEGLDRTLAKAVQQEWEQMREQPYSEERLRNFFQKFARQLPAGANPVEASTSNLDLDTHTVDVVVSFAPATQAEKTE